MDDQQKIEGPRLPDTMSAQDLFDLNWDWFIVQNRPKAYDADTGMCVYRRWSDGARCGIGVAMTDDEVRALEADGRDVIVEILSAQGFLPDRLEDIPSGLLEELQACHDESEGKEDHRTNLMNLAARHGLRMPVVE